MTIEHTASGRNHTRVPYLLTPGPLTTSATVKEVMMRDWGSRDHAFRDMTADVRAGLLDVANDRDGALECVPVQGSGTFAVEAMIGTFVPDSGKALVLINGAYGRRMAEICRYLGRRHVTIDKGDFRPPRGEDVATALEMDPDITHVVVVHCETSSGILNPLAEIAAAVRAKGCSLLIDSMSAFGALVADPREIGYDALAASSNKCLEGVPGVGFVIARKSALLASEGNCHSLSLDLCAQWQAMNRNRQWRFTPPTHVVAALWQALRELRDEGGVVGRLERYARNRDTLVSAMRGLGFRTLLPDSWLSPIIVSFLYPGHENFDFERFYTLMAVRGFLLYPGKLTELNCFRMGCIGRLDEDVMLAAVDAVAGTLHEMGVPDGCPSPRNIALLDKEEFTF